jgi:hypothetical protein
MPAGKAQQVIELWRAAAREKVAGAEVELAAGFQRHYTKLGTGLPPNFCLVLTADEVLAFKFDPRNSAHPLSVGAGQIKKQAGRWPRGALRVGEIEPGRLAVGFVLEIDEPAGTRSIPCRTPRLTVNPAAAAMLVEFGGVLPEDG